MPTETPTSADQQVRLFDPTRYSPVTVDIWQRLPESNARAFAIASALGSFRDASGSSDKLRSGRQARGSVITRKRLSAVRAAIGISDRQWRRYKKEWVQLYVAHECQPGTLTLFTQPVVQDPCPGCGQAMEFDHVPEHHRRARAAHRMPNGRFAATEPAAVRPDDGRNAATSVDGMRPDIEPDRYARRDRSLLGLEVGMPPRSPVIEEVQGHKAGQKTRPRVQEIEEAR
jgi:hypothetical protein